MGGLTETYALTADSPALNAGDNDFARDINRIRFTNDQRGIGFRRIEFTTVDIGAFEVQPA